jgi:hypothetical protein
MVREEVKVLTRMSAYRVTSHRAVKEIGERVIYMQMCGHKLTHIPTYIHTYILSLGHLRMVFCRKKTDNYDTRQTDRHDRTKRAYSHLLRVPVFSCREERLTASAVVGAHHREAQGILQGRTRSCQLDPRACDSYGRISVINMARVSIHAHTSAVSYYRTLCWR